MQVTEIRILTYMSGSPRKDRIRDEYVRGIFGMAVITDKMRERRLRLFGHAMSQGEEGLVRAMLELRVNGRWGRDGPKLTWEQEIPADISVCSIDETFVQYRRAWKTAIR